MKKALSLLSLAAASAFAASAPQTHDGFFLSFAMGCGYQSVEYDYEGRHYQQFNTSGMSTDLDLKIGGRIGDNLLLHMTLTGATSLGTEKANDNEEVKANLSLWGIGTTYYFPGNYLASASIGVSQFNKGSDVPAFTASVDDFIGNMLSGLAFQIAGGKEWWVSENWGVGATAALLYGFDFDVHRESSLSVAIRLTATWN